MRKLLSVLLAMMLLVSFSAVATAEGDVEYKNIKITYNGEKIILLNEDDEQQQSIIADGKVYVPIECFVNTISGEITYSESENTLTIVFPARQTGDSNTSVGASSRDYSDDDIAALLPSGRWSCVNESGTSFLDFNSDHTGKMAALLDFVWAINDGVVSIDYTVEGQQWHKEMAYQVADGSAQLVMLDNGWVFTLDGAVDAMIGIMGTWYVVGDSSTQLEILMDATFKMNVSGLTYSGTWAMGQSQIYLTQNNSTISGDYNGTSIGLNIGSKHFTFTR